MAKRVQRKANNMGLWLGLGAVVAVLGVGLVLSITAQPPGQKFPSQGNRHIQSLDEVINPPYNTNPPTSGPHTDARPYFTIYEEQLPDPLAVHGLEDGGVIVHYHPDLAPADDVAKVKAMLNSQFKGRNPRIPNDTLDHVILQPNPTIETAWALTAWTRLDTLDTYDEARIARFVKAYKGIDHHPR